MVLGALTDVLRVHVLDWPTKRRFAKEIALGMALVHSLGRMHRDLKSGNVLVTAHSGAMTLTVAGGGTATLLDKASSRGDRVAATILPQPQGGAGAESDTRHRTHHTKG